MTTLSYTLTIELIAPTELRAQAVFPDTYMGFQGHFPGKPILPGFLHVQLALDLLRAARLPHILRRISAGKFTRPVLPDTEVRIGLVLTDCNSCEVTLSQNNETLSTFALEIE